MGRSADYTIQGFLYQFNKTLLAVLTSADESTITAEGPIEDIEVVSNHTTTAIQCKYHETKKKFMLSAIYEPLLQMLLHFHLNKKSKVNYVLFAHFPNISQITVTKLDLEEALASTNKHLKKAYIDNIKGGIDLDSFLKKFKSEVGPKFDTLVKDVHSEMKLLAMSDSDIQTLHYPNAIQIIANLSIQHNPDKRKIRKNELLNDLQKIRSTAITHWTLALKTRKSLLQARRKQLKPNLATNTRLRYLLLHEKSLKDFNTNIVLFIKAYLDKYHFKAAHVSTPLFCLDVSEDDFREIEIRLGQKDILMNDGVFAGVFNETRFFRDPMISKEKKEFSLRILRWNGNERLLEKRKPDDFFVLGAGGYGGLNTTDVSVEELATDSFDEINFMMGISNVCE